jgi:hypothetical protein
MPGWPRDDFDRVQCQGQSLCAPTIDIADGVDPAARDDLEQRRCHGRGVRHVACKRLDLNSVRATCLSNVSEFRAIAAEQAQLGRGLLLSKGSSEPTAGADYENVLQAGFRRTRENDLTSLRGYDVDVNNSFDAEHDLRFGFERARPVRKLHVEPTLCSIVGRKRRRNGFVSQRQPPRLTPPAQGRSGSSP